jgi:RHS repeat-associated protein
LQFGTTAYTYGRNGELQSKTSPAGTTTYEYDVFGTLQRVTLPDARVVTYENDPLGRRITKRIDGTVMRRWIWLDALRPIAELDGAGNLVAHFVYAGGINVPEYIVRHDAPGTYRLIKDHLGSVRLVVDANTGTVLQEMRYDAFGRVIADSAPGWQPFGFAGGLYDADTGITRFGARDYDAAVGRWTAKDPIRFGGGDTNLYAYCADDPVNCRDVTGEAGETIGPLPPSAPRNWVPKDPQWIDKEIGAANLRRLLGVDPAPAVGSVVPPSNKDDKCKRITLQDSKPRNLPRTRSCLDALRICLGAAASRPTIPGKVAWGLPCIAIAFKCLFGGGA